jgi:hypothetical protein
MEHPDEGQNLGSLFAEKSENVRNFLRRYTQTDRICKVMTIDFALENINDKYSTEMSSPGSN